MITTIRLYVILVFLSIALPGCGGTTPPQGQGTEPPPHAPWTSLLEKYVDSEGWVDYRGFQRDSLALNRYLSTLSQSPPDPQGWSRAEQLAYWINAYNAYTVKLIIDNYPLESIEDLHPTLYIPALNTVWHRKFFRIGGQPTSLDEIEHQILRKQFSEPRIHFAINCASVSCPVLRNEAYTAQKLESQLNDQARRFINDSNRNQLSADRVKLSKIFSWFQGDFTKNTTLINYINQYSNRPLSPDAKVSYMDYNWKLNEQPTRNR